MNKQAMPRFTNAQVLEQIKEYHALKGSSPETARVSLSIAKNFLLSNGKPLTEEADPDFYSKLGILAGIAFPPFPKSYKSRIGALFRAHQGLAANLPIEAISPAGSAPLVASAPQDDRLYRPGAFPFAAMSEVQRAICEAMAAVHQLPIELVAMPALAVAAAALGKSWKLAGAVNGRETFGNLYIVAGAPTSAGKGAAAQLAAPIMLASDKLAEDWSKNEKPKLETQRQTLLARTKHMAHCLVRQNLPDDLRSTLESSLRQANQELNRIKPLLAACPSHHVGNATSEALAMRFHRNDDTLFAIACEGADTLRVMLGKYARGNHADFDLWLSGYSVEPYGSDRILRGNVNITPCLTALIFCQPSLLGELLDNEEAFERGLIGRVLPFICAPDLKEDDGEARCVPTGCRDAWHKLIAGLLDRRGSISVSPGKATLSRLDSR